MKKNDLKLMWKEAHYMNNEINLSKASIKKAMRLKHSKVISRTISDMKLKIFLYTMIFIIYIGLMIYALMYLKLNLSLKSLVPLSLVGIFLLTAATSEFVRLSVFTKTADNHSLKESVSVFYKKLKIIKTTDFIIYIVFFYLSAILVIFNYLTDIGGVRNLSWNTEIVPVPLLGILVLMLLSVPWFVKYQNNQRYKKLYSNLIESAHQLKDQPDNIS